MTGEWGCCHDPVVLVGRYRGWGVMTGVAVGVLVVLAVRADGAAPLPSWWLTGADVAVGVGFVAAGAAAPGPVAQRVLVAAVGVAWLVGSLVPVARSWHQGVLVLALGWFASGRPRGAAGWVIAGLAVVVTVQFVPQAAVAVVFVLVAAAAVVRGRVDPIVAWYPAGSAVAVAVCLFTVWASGHVTSRPLDPVFAVVGYEVVLLGVAALFPVGAGTALRVRNRLADRLLSEETGGGVDGLVGVLRGALGDPTLRVFRWQDGVGGYVDGAGDPVAEGAVGRGWLVVDAGSGPVAAVVSRAAALEDPPTAAAVRSAVLLAVTNIALQEQQRARLRKLEASRARIVAAGDRQRQRVASLLRAEVDPPLQAARAAVDAVREDLDRSEADATLGVVAGELATAAGEIGDLVAGIAPAQLGGGRLAGAVRALSERSPVTVTVTAAADATGGRDAETALYYVCSEALANAVKHARANRVAIDLALRRGDLVATITDNGCGGADPAGQGLQGLADRLAACHGRLRVDSPPGAGTTVTATVRP